MRVRSLGREDPLEKGMATHSSILAWRIPWTREPGGLQSMGSPRMGHGRATKQQQQWQRYPLSYWNTGTTAAADAKSLQSCPPLLRPHGLLPARLLCPWNSPGKNTFLLQGIFPTQGPNPCLLHWQVDSLSLSHQGIIPDWFLKAPNPSLVLPSS